MKRSFTILEVLIAVTIAALVGVAFLKGASVQLDALHALQKKDRINDLATLFANHRDLRFNHLQKEAEAFLPFAPKDDALRHYLKRKFSYQEHPLPLKQPLISEGVDLPQIRIKQIVYRRGSEGDYFYVVELHE